MYLSAPAGASFAGGTNGGSDRVSGGSQRIDPHTDEWSTHLGAEEPPSPVAGRGLDHQGTRPTPSAPCLLEWGARSGGGGTPSSTMTGKTRSVFFSYSLPSPATLR